MKSRMKGRIIAAIVVALVALSASTSVAQRRVAALGDSPAALVERARAAYNQGRYQDALETARRAAEAAPRSLPAQLARGGMAEFMGEFDEAQRAYSQALALAPHDLTARYRTAVLSVRVGEYDRALRELDTILATQSRTAQFVFRWAPPIVQTRLLRDNPALEQLVQTQIDILMEKGDLAEARRLARRHGVVESGHNYCADANARKTSNAGSDAVFHAFRLAALGQPDAADCIWWYGQWLTDEGYMRLGRLMVEEGTRLTPSQANRDSGARYVRIRCPSARSRCSSSPSSATSAMATWRGRRDCSTSPCGWPRASRDPTRTRRGWRGTPAPATRPRRCCAAASKPIPSPGAPGTTSAARCWRSSAGRMPSTP